MNKIRFRNGRRNTEAEASEAARLGSRSMTNVRFTKNLEQKSKNNWCSEWSGVDALQLGPIMFDMKLNSLKLDSAICSIHQKSWTKVQKQLGLRMIRGRCSTTWIHNVWQETQLPQTRSKLGTCERDQCIFPGRRNTPQEQLLYCAISIGDMFDSQKTWTKSPKTIGAENDQESMLYNMDP